MALPIHPGWRIGSAHQRGLSYEQAEAIREAYATGNFTQQQLGDAYGVSQPAICVIVQRRTHRNAAPPARVPARILTSEERIERWTAAVNRWTAAVNATPAPLMDAKQAEIDRRNREDAPYGYRAFRDGR
jgi:hypothetical protein